MSKHDDRISDLNSQAVENSPEQSRPFSERAPVRFTSENNMPAPSRHQPLSADMQKLVELALQVS